MLIVVYVMLRCLHSNAKSLYDGLLYHRNTFHFILQYIRH